MQIEEILRAAPLLRPADVADTPFVVYHATKFQEEIKAEAIRLINESGFQPREWFTAEFGELFYKGFAYFLLNQISRSNDDFDRNGELNYLHVDLCITKNKMYEKGGEIWQMNSLINIAGAIAFAYHQCFYEQLCQEKYVTDLMKMIYKIPKRNLAFQGFNY